MSHAPHHPPREFKAPEVFSLIENPARSIRFCRDIEKLRKKRDIFVDLSEVTRITPDAIALLLSIVMKRGTGNVQVSGNYPEDANTMKTLRESGFDEYLKSSLPAAKQSRGAIVKRDLVRADTQAKASYARMLVDFAAKDDGNLLRLQATYGHLLDCMANTHEHANPVAGTESWWASVFQDKERNRDCFTFIDMGVGIFGSIQMGMRFKLWNLVGSAYPSVLRRLLNGEIPSSTGKSYRGHGLPSIAESMKSSQIQRLIIITNEVYADVEGDDFRELPYSLPGLLLYWEVPL